MATINFTGTFATSNTFSTTLGAGLTAGTSINFTSNGINFTFSMTVTNTNGFPILERGLAAVSGTFGTLTATARSSFGSGFSVSYVLSFATSANRTAFTSNASFSNLFLSNLSGSTNVVGNKMIFSGQSTSWNTGFFLHAIQANFLCFCEGTMIDTVNGPVAVEDLKPGEQLCTADGGKTMVRWIGTRHVDTALQNPRKANPIRISAGALGKGLPRRDLMVSPDHGIGMDGYLINAAALVNGTTITQLPSMPRAGFTYYHVETDAHELILSEGVAAETFIDYTSTDGFENGDMRADARIAEMSLPRISAARMLPEGIRDNITNAPAQAA